MYKVQSRQKIMSIKVFHIATMSKMPLHATAELPNWQTKKYTELAINLYQRSSWWSNSDKLWT